MTLDEKIKELMLKRQKEELQPWYRKAARGVGKFGKEIAKDTFNTVIVRPGTRIGQVASYGIGNIVGGERGEQIKRKALEDQKVDLGKFGTYDNRKVDNYKKVAGEALDSAATLYAPGATKVVGKQVLKQTVKQTVKQSAKTGAKIGAAYEAGKYLQEDDFNTGTLIKRTATGAVLGGAGGAVIAGTGAVVSKVGKKVADKVARGEFKDPKILGLEKEWDRIQTAKLKTDNKTAVKNYEKAQKAIELRMDEARQAGFIKNPFVDDTDKSIIPSKKSGDLDSSKGIFDNLSKKDLELYGKDLPEIGKTSFFGGASGTGKELADRIPQELDQIGVFAQASKSIEVRRDARKLVRLLSDRIEDENLRIPKLIELGKKLESAGTEEGKIIKAAIDKMTAIDVTKAGSNKIPLAISGSGNKGSQLPPKSPTTPKTGPVSGSSTPDDVSSFYNVDRLNIKDSQKKAILSEIDNAGKQLEKTVGKTLTHKEVVDAAAESSAMLKQVVTREQTLASEAAGLNLRKAVAEASKLDDKGKLVDPKKLIDLALKDKSIGEDIARQLEARKIVADPSESTAIQRMLNSIFDKTKKTDDIVNAAKDVDFNDPEAVTKFFRNFVKPKTEDWIDLIRYNSMLSSPTTHIVNASSNYQGTGIIAPIEKTITGVTDAIRSALTGTPRKYAVGEGAAYAKGYYSNVATAAKAFWETMRKSAVSTQTDFNKAVPLTTSKTGRVVERTLDAPMRLMEATDNFFKALTEGGIEKSLAYRAKRGMSTKLSDVEKEATERLFRGEFDKEGEGVLLKALSGVGNLAYKLRHSESKVLSTIGKFTVPFVRTPINLFKAGIEFNPILGTVNLIGNQNKAEAISKLVIGTAATAGAATLLGQDRLTWAEPTSAKQKEYFRASGRQPYSVRIGDKWVSYSKMHPAVAFNFALISAVDDWQKNKGLSEDESDGALAIGAKYLNFLVDQTYLRNIGDMVASVKGDEERIARLVGNYAQQLIPFRALSGWIERLIDPYQRQIDPDGTMLEKQWQLIQSQIPGLGDNVPARTGPLGAPIENSNPFLNALSPNRITDVNKPYEGLYQIDRMDRKINGIDAEIDEKIERMIRQKMMEAKQY